MDTYATVPAAFMTRSLGFVPTATVATTSCVVVSNTETLFEPKLTV